MWLITDNVQKLIIFRYYKIVHMSLPLSVKLSIKMRWFIGRTDLFLSWVKQDPLQVLALQRVLTLMPIIGLYASTMRPCLLTNFHSRGLYKTNSLNSEIQLLRKYEVRCKKVNKTQCLCGNLFAQRRKNHDLSYRISNSPLTKATTQLQIRVITRIKLLILIPCNNSITRQMQ